MPIYMKYGSIKGDVTATGHEGWIELQSAQLGTRRNITWPSGRGVNRESASPAIKDITVTKLQDSSSADLFREAVNGRGVDVEIHFLKTGGGPNPYLTIKLQGVLISSMNISGRGGDSHSTPMESLTLNFAKIEYSVGGTKNTQPQAPPPQTLTWDLGEITGG